MKQVLITLATIVCIGLLVVLVGLPLIALSGFHFG